MVIKNKIGKNGLTLININFLTGFVSLKIVYCLFEATFELT